MSKTELAGESELLERSLGRRILLIGLVLAFNSAVLLIGSWLIPDLAPFTGVILVGTATLVLASRLPGRITIHRDLLVVGLWLASALLAYIVYQFICMADLMGIRCQPQTLRAVLFGTLFFPGIIILVVWGYLRVLRRRHSIVSEGHS